MAYRCVAPNVDTFVQQLAVSYVSKGYWFYVTGIVPAGKDPAAVDEKLIERYGIDLTKWARARRRKLGRASMQYIRHDRFFVLLATHGEHEFFELEKSSIRDVRHTAIRYARYTISYRGGHPHVAIDRAYLAGVRAHLETIASRVDGTAAAETLRSLRFRPFAPVRRQLLTLMRHTNDARARAGHPPLFGEFFDFRRKPVDLMMPSPETAASLRSRIERASTSALTSAVEDASPSSLKSGSARSRRA